MKLTSRCSLSKVSGLSGSFQGLRSDYSQILQSYGVRLQCVSIRGTAVITSSLQVQETAAVQMTSSIFSKIQRLKPAAHAEARKEHPEIVTS